MQKTFSVFAHLPVGHQGLRQQPYMNSLLLMISKPKAKYRSEEQYSAIA
jgi:hypothetical protein